MIRTTKCGFNDGPHGSGADLLVSVGPTLFVDVGFDPNYDALVEGAKPIPGVENVHALVDTGATECCIDSALALSLNLPVVDRRKISGISGLSEVNVHLAQVHVSSLLYTMYGLFSAVDLAAGGQNHQVLIGRTFLKDFLMTYEGTTGTVVISHHSVFSKPFFPQGGGAAPGKG
jgi:predicted aspartyl protease